MILDHWVCLFVIWKIRECHRRSWIHAKGTTTTPSKKEKEAYWLESRVSLLKVVTISPPDDSTACYYPFFCVFQASLILKTNCKEMCTPQAMHCKNRGNKTSTVRRFGETVTSGRLICWTRYFKTGKGYSFCKGTGKTSFSLRNVLSISISSEW